MQGQTQEVEDEKADGGDGESDDNSIGGKKGEFKELTCKRNEKGSRHNSNNTDK